MQLLTPADFCHKHFGPDSQPPETTLRKWLRDGVLPARKIGGRWYIDELAFLAGDDELVERVLKAQ